MASGAKESTGESGSAAGAEMLRASLGSECPICLGAVRRPAFVAYCMHRFCFSCIRHWAQAREGCLVCRQSLEQVLHSVRGDDDYKLFVVGLPTPLRRRMAMERARGCHGHGCYNLCRRLATDLLTASQSEPMARRREPVVSWREPMASWREPMAGRRQTMAGRREPMAGRREPMSGRRERMAGRSEPVDTESSQGQGAAPGPSRIPAQSSPAISTSQESSHRTDPGAPPATQNGTQ